MHHPQGRHGTAPELRHMEIGDYVIHDGRQLVLRGLEPMSVPDGRAEVTDPRTGERLFVPIAELQPALPRPGVSGREG
jgi:hypothetical protein